MLEACLRCCCAQEVTGRVADLQHAYLCQENKNANSHKCHAYTLKQEGQQVFNQGDVADAA